MGYNLIWMHERWLDMGICETLLRLVSPHFPISITVSSYQVFVDPGFLLPETITDFTELQLLR
jgi:hypothetical protein